MYIIGYESAFNEKPRQRLDEWMYNRPLFYGMSRRMKSEAERLAYIEMARRNKSPRCNALTEMNERANNGPSVQVTRDVKQTEKSHRAGSLAPQP